MAEIGKFLTDKDIIGHNEMSDVIKTCQKTGSSFADVIMATGNINPYQLYSSIAELKGLEFADLAIYPCDSSLICENERKVYTDLKAIPWQKYGDEVVIAACDDNEQVKQWAKGKYKQYRIAITTPFDINNAVNTGFEAANNNDAINALLMAEPQYSAKNLFAGVQAKIFAAFLASVAASFIYNPVYALTAIFLIVSVFYIATLFFKTMLFAIGYLKRVSNKSTHINNINEHDLPVYTILVPLYREAEVLPKLVDAIRNIDYPKSKLDVKLIVESDDELTINAIINLKCERIFEMVKVPYSLPRTKPKACNYALQFAKGEFVTIYDAEDEPEPLQLKKALSMFYNSLQNVACVQARLNYFNRKDNLLTRLFSIEYSNLFDFLLPGLEAMEVPIPLGGTSNHFRTKTLKELYYWDPYNVTEDADLGLRIAAKGWRSVMIDSFTEEECPVNITTWIKQRSRWIKGHMQTYFVHMRHPLQLIRKVGITGFMGIQFFLGAPALIFLISPFMWGLWACFITGIIIVPDNMPDIFTDIISISEYILFAGISIQAIYAVISVKFNKWDKMALAVAIFPFYWILHSIASFKAVYQLITNPHYWEKTTHGVSKLRS